MPVESAIRFGTDNSLVGIVSSPDRHSRQADAFGVVLLNAGIIHRVGPHRMNVRLARALAQQGATALRFDHAGIGDSPARKDALSFQDAARAEVRQAIEWLRVHKGCSRFVLIGLCSGTLTSFRAAGENDRVVGMVLLNALLEDATTLSDDVVNDTITRKVARSYLADKVWSARSWAKLLKGGTDLRRVVGVVAARLKGLIAGPPLSAGGADVLRQLDEMSGRGVATLFVFSDGGTVHEYFRASLGHGVRALSKHAPITVEVLDRADHNFTALEDQKRVEELVTQWAMGLAPLPVAEPALGHGSRQSRWARS